MADNVAAHSAAARRPAGEPPKRVSGATAAFPKDNKPESVMHAGRQEQLTLLVLLGEDVPTDTPPTFLAPESVSKVVFPRFAQYIKENYPDRVKVIAGASLDSFLVPCRAAALAHAEALFVLGVDLKSFRELLLHVGQQLRWIHSYGAGVTSLIAALRETPWPGCPAQMWASQPQLLVTNGRTVFSRPLAEYVFAAILHFYKRVPHLVDLQKKCAWSRFPLCQLRGKVMGFLGYGDVGRACAILAKAFDMKCTALRSSRTKGSNDVVSVERVWTPSCEDRLETPETKSSVGAIEFSAMKKTGIFISIGRGTVVDEEALLKTKSIAAAALDVFQKEPLPADSPLWKEENILISSHCCDWVDDHSAASTLRVFDENLRRFLAGAYKSSEMYTPIDVHKGY